LPVGLFVGSGGGRGGGGFKPGVRAFLADHGSNMPKKTNGCLDLRRDGGESLLRNLGKIVGLIMQEAYGEKLAMIAWIACLGKWRVGFRVYLIFGTLVTSMSASCRTTSRVKGCVYVFIEGWHNYNEVTAFVKCATGSLE